MKKIVFLFLLAVSSLSTSFAQKYGHINFGNLVAGFPETKQADAAMKTYQEQLVKKGEQMAADWRKKAEEFVKKVQGGTIPPAEQAKQEAALQKEQQDILAYEQEVIQKVEAKREELLKPIFDKAQNAIDAVAKSNGYTMVFDTSIPNAVLFVQESDDIMSLVKAKLGM